MKILTTLSFATLLAFSVFGADSVDPLNEIFYAPFDDSPNAVIARGSIKGGGAAPKDAGVVGKAGVANFDARGNVDLDRGAIAFFLKLPKAPAEMDWDGYAVVSGQGYWSFIMSPLMVVPEHFCMQFFNVGLYTQRLDWPYLAKTWKADEWHHVAMVWDRNEGITVYEDGKRIGSNWGSYSWEWNLAPANLTMSHGLMDEFHVYSVPLTDAQIAQLAKHEKPMGDPIPITPEAKRRQKDLARMGWLDEELKELPVVIAGQPQEYTFAHIMKCWDAKRAYAEPFDGFKATPWPHQMYGPSTHGQFAELDLAPNQKYDRVTLFAQRAFRGELQELIPGVGYKTIKPVDAREGTFWRSSLSAMRTDPHLALTREVGRLGEVQLYRVESLKQAPAKTPIFFSKLEKMPDSDAGLALLAETPTRFDNPLRGTTTPSASWKLAAPAFGGFQALTEAKAEPQAADGVLITLVAEGITKPTPVQIVVKEPVWSARDWLVADALLKPNGTGRQVFVLRLRGRPVVSMPNAEFAMFLTAGEPVTWMMGKDGCSLDLCQVPMDQALPIATEDQVEFARCGHYNVNEGHQFGDPIFDRPFRWLCAFAPDRPETREMVFLRGLPEGTNTKVSAPIFDIPKNDIGAPEWAFWQMQALNVNRRITHWWIDNWQTPMGEFGGLWGDDTDFVENWVGMALCADEDGKIKNSLRRIWNGLWTYCLDQGVSRYTMDDCHSYEEGMGAIAQQMLVDYGDPVAVEHTMAASSHYDKWMRKLDDGTYRWKSAYFGVNGCWDYGAFANDSNGGMLVLIPANYLIWYNRNPDVAKYFRGLKGLADGAGISTDSYHLLTADAQTLAGVYAKRVLDAKWIRYAQAVNGMVSVSGVTDEIRKQFAPAEYKPLPPFDKYSFGAQFDDAKNWNYFQTTGDTRYLADTWKRTFEFVNSEWWLYTAADPSRDRIPLPDNSLVIARMGALPTQRGAQGTYLPWHGLSYEKGAGEVAALVTVNTDKELKARFYAFPEKPLALTTRVWRLLPGTYKVTLSKDANDAGQPEETILTKEATLDRGAYLELTLPVRQPVVLTVTAIKTAPLNFDRPDPAISPSDVKLVYNEHLTVPVHNLGAKPVENLLVRVRDGRSGKVIGEKRIPRIDPPVGLKPSKNGVEFLNFNCITDSSIIVEIDPDHEIDDLNRYNNKVEYKY